MDDYQELDWDSEFFGFRIARIVPRTLDENRLESILSTLRRRRVRLAYWASDGESDASRAAGVMLGGQLVDRKATYLLSIENEGHEWPQDPADPVVPFDGQTANRELERLAIQAGELSRFRQDERIPVERFETLYKTWIRRSVTGEIADAVLVIRDDNDKIAGMITLGEKDGRGDIGLVAVDPAYRGKGYGRMLVIAAIADFGSRGYEFSQVVTQADNRPACRLYESVGYELESCENFFHFWLA